MHRRLLLAALALAGLFAAPALAAVVPVHLSVISGTPQSGRAWVAARANFYETHFDRALTVRVSRKIKVRFTCITHGCEFPAQDQPDAVTRVDPNAYDVEAAKGQAAIKLIVWTVTPQRVVVVARPADLDEPQVRFNLDAQ